MESIICEYISSLYRIVQATVNFIFLQKTITKKPNRENRFGAFFVDMHIFQIAVLAPLPSVQPFGLTTRAARNEKMIAAEMPALVTSKMPVMTPIQPSR